MGAFLCCVKCLYIWYAQFWGMNTLLQERYFALEIGFANKFAALVNAGNFTASEKKEFKAAVTANDLARWGYISIVENVAVLNLVGAMERYGNWWGVSTEQTGQIIDIVNSDPAIEAILLRIDSPGGAVNGTAALADIIKNNAKPVGAWVAGMAASAAYYVGSQASFIKAESKKASFIGSIGVLEILVDQTQQLANEGVKITILRAAKSQNKALLNPYEPAPDAALAEEQKMLNAIEGEFHKAVKAGRPGISDQVFADQAKMYDGATALKLGMIDSIGSLADAVAELQTLAATSPKNRKQKSKSNMSQKSYSGLAVLAGLSAFVSAELSEDSVGVSEAHLDALEAGASALQVQLATALADKKKAEDSLATATESLTALNASLSAAIADKDAAVSATATAQAEADRLQGLITASNEAIGNTGNAPNVDPAPVTVSAVEAAAARKAELAAKFPKLAK